MSKDAVAIIRDPENGVFFSAASAWELELKAARGRLDLPATWLDAAKEAGFVHMSITAQEARASAHLPWHHTDPFDRMLVAQAQSHSLTLATRDALLAPYGVALLEI